MKTKRARRLRWRLAVPLTVAFFLLWLGTMMVLTNSACDRLEGTASQEYEYAKKALEEQWEIYQNNRDNGLGAQADHILMYNLSAASGGLTDIGEGGMAFLVRNSLGQEVHSQLAYGYGHEAGVDQGQRWYLYFDDGLDDEGQLQLARWITQRRIHSWDFALYPPDSWPWDTLTEDGSNPPNADGTYARVTGVERSGYAMDVQKIELVHPDGTTETMVETDTTGEDSITLELKFMRVASVLVPDYYSDRNDGPIDMELRLSHFRAAQDRVHRGTKEMYGSSLTVSGQLSGISEGNAMRLVAGEYDTTRAAVQGQWFLYLSTFLLTAVAVLLLSAHLSKQVTRPVEQLSQGAQKGRCETDGPVQELNALAEAFNAAQDQLEGQLERERAFTRGAAHELKTPLAIIRTHAEALGEDIAPEKRGEYLNIILEESDRMGQLVGRLLELTRLESGVALNVAPLNLADVVREVWNPLALQLEQKEVSLSLELEEVWLEGDRERLKEAVGNLASNALRHVEKGKRIQVSLVKQGEQAYLSVYNDGPLISEKDLPHLFEPFYRGDKSRSRDSGGTGLGLAIVRAAVSAHGGSCGVEQRAGGPCFWLCLPVGQDEETVS